MTYKVERVFNPNVHIPLVHQKLINYGYCPDAFPNVYGFRTLKYSSTEFSFHIGTGIYEPKHVDTRAYQAIMILEPNGWVVRNEVDPKGTFQEPGDLIILDQSRMHSVCWDKHFAKPTKPWIHLFIDIYQRDKWAKTDLSEYKAAELAMTSIESIQDPAHWNWFTTNN